MPTTDPFPRGSGAPLRTSSVGAPEPDVRRAGRAQSTSMLLMDVAVGAPCACLELEAGRGRLPGQGRWFELLRYTGRVRWGGWGSWDDPERQHVQICHKGVPRRDRPRTKARNISVSLRVPRLDRGLCGRFGQTAPPRAPGRGAAGRPATTAGLRTGPVLPGAGGPGDPCTEAGRVRTRPIPLLLAPR